MQWQLQLTYWNMVQNFGDMYTSFLCQLGNGYLQTLTTKLTFLFLLNLCVDVEHHFYLCTYRKICMCIQKENIGKTCQVLLQKTLVGYCIFLVLTFGSCKYTQIHRINDVTHLLLSIYLCCIMNQQGPTPFAICYVSEYIYVHCQKWYFQ